MLLLMLMLRLWLLVFLLMIGLRVRLTVRMRRIAARMVLASAVALVTRQPVRRAAMSSEQKVQMVRGGVLRVRHAVRRLPRMLLVPEQTVAIEAGAQIRPLALVRGRATSGLLDLVGVGRAAGVVDGRHVGTAALMRRIAKRRMVEPPQPAVSSSVPVTANSLMLWEIV